jgi:hypothetical protein
MDYNIAIVGRIKGTSWVHQGYWVKHWICILVNIHNAACVFLAGLSQIQEWQRSHSNLNTLLTSQVHGDKFCLFLSLHLWIWRSDKLKNLRKNRPQKIGAILGPVTINLEFYLWKASSIIWSTSHVKQVVSFFSILAGSFSNVFSLLLWCAITVLSLWAHSALS